MSTTGKQLRSQTQSVEELQSVWSDFLHREDQAAKRRLMMQYIGLVRYVLHNLNLPPSPVLGEEDLVQFGILGLNDALDRYDDDRGVKFETFAIPRIRGMILDEVRRADWLSRTARKRSQDFLQTADKLRAEYGREVSQEEIRQRLGLSAEEYKMYLRAAAAATGVINMNDTHGAGEDDDGGADPVYSIPDDSSPDALTAMTEQERVDTLTRYLERLPERKRLVMTLYYFKNLTFKEIGVLLKVSESRVCQIHSAVLVELRKKLKDV